MDHEQHKRAKKKTACLFPSPPRKSIDKERFSVNVCEGKGQKSPAQVLLEV